MYIVSPLVHNRNLLMYLMNKTELLFKVIKENHIARRIYYDCYEICIHNTDIKVMIFLETVDLCRT